MGLPARLYGPALVATGPTTKFTNVATERVRNILVFVSNPTASAVSYTLSIGADAAGTRVVGTNTVANIPANTATPVIFGPYVLHPSEIMTESAGTNNVLVSTAMGDRNLVA